MCGIAGIIKYQSSREVLQVLGQKMGDAIAHRGPDDQGYWIDSTNCMLLVHRRLSIQDLSPLGHQPMVSSGGRYVIVFNGEIYNFKELAKSLRQHGFSFKGSSDTEVMLAAFEHWGVVQAIERFVGMFAFALFDRKDEVLTLCRDRMGEKPLYYGWVGDRFVFASELKSIVAVFDKPLDIDEKALSAYFRFGYIPAPYSIYKGIYKLEPGCYLPLSFLDAFTPESFSPFVGDSKLSPKTYWSVESAAYSNQHCLLTDQHQAVDELDQLLQKIIKNQMIADVSTGAFLSGGVDSTTVAAIMQAVSHNPIHTFTIGFEEKEFDEAPYAKAIAKHLGTCHNELYISADDCLNVVDKIPQYWDEPFADSSQIPAYIVSKFAKQHVTVCLSGDGGDELFCGYNRYIATHSLWGKIDKLPFAVRNLVATLMLAVPPDTYGKIYAALKYLSNGSTTQANVGLKVHKLAELIRFSNIHEVYKYLMSYWSEPLSLVRSSGEASSILDRQVTPNFGGFINDAMYWDQKGYLPDDNLVKGDRSSMASSLETRMPLLDHRLVEFSWRLPVEMKVQQGLSKWALRQVLYKYVPRHYIERPKMGFSVPIGAWLRGPLNEWASDLFSTAQANPLFRGAEINRVWMEHQSGERDHSHKLWALAMFMAWYAHYR